MSQPSKEEIVDLLHKISDEDNTEKEININNYIAALECGVIDPDICSHINCDELKQGEGEDGVLTYGSESKKVDENKPGKKYYTYMLRCTDGSLYTGITTDIKRRMDEHFSKGVKCAKYTKRHTAKKLEAVWESSNRVLASKLEYRIKQLPKDKKEALIQHNNIEVMADKIAPDKYKRLFYYDSGLYP